MKFIVTAQSFDNETGVPTTVAREEEIDTNTNSLFKHAKTIKDVHDVYENFWMGLNKNVRELVFVQSIRIKS